MPELCQYDTKISKNTETQKIFRRENEIDVSHCDTMRHCDTSVTPKVFKFIRLSKYGQRARQGNLLFYSQMGLGVSKSSGVGSGVGANKLLGVTLRVYFFSGASLRVEFLLHVYSNSLLLKTISVKSEIQAIGRESNSLVYKYNKV
jgi:hypothetical protein